MTTKDSFGARQTLEVGARQYEIASLRVLRDAGYAVDRLPFSLRILLENLLRNEDGESVTREDIEFLARWNPQAQPEREIACACERSTESNLSQALQMINGPLIHAKLQEKLFLSLKESTQQRLK